MNNNINHDQQFQQEEGGQSKEEYLEKLKQQFSLENLEPMKWKNISDKIYQLNNFNEEQTLPQIYEAFQLTYLLANIENPDEVLCDAKVKKFFLEENLLKIAKDLILNKCFKNKQCYQYSDYILQNIALIAIKYINENNPRLAEALQVATENYKPYFNNFNCSSAQNGWNVHRQQKMTPEYQQWLQNIQTGTQVDAMKITDISSSSEIRKFMWAPGVVSQVQDQLVYVVFDDDLPSEDRTINLHHFEIFPRGEKCKDYEWRYNLKEGDEFDCVDNNNVWYRSTALQFREREIETDGINRKIKEVFVAYRYYRENGVKTEQNTQRNYFGWHAKYDEWITVSSPRIKKAGYVTDILHAQHIKPSNIIDDACDEFYEIDGKKCNIIIRDLQSASKGTNMSLLQVLQKMDQNGLFQKIIEKIEDKNNWVPIDCLAYYLQFFSQIQPYFHRDFAREINDRIFEAAEFSLLNSPSQNIRNFTKDKIEYILRALRELLKRTTHDLIRNEKIDKLDFKIALICFESDFLERKIQGLKQFQEILSNSQAMEDDRFKKVIQWVKENNIFEKLYASNNANLITRSSQFMRIIVQEEQLDLENLELVWKGTQKNDHEQKLAILKVFWEISKYLNFEHKEFIISRIKEVAPNQVIKEEIELVVNLLQFNSDQQSTQQQIDIYWNILENSQGVSNDIIDLSIKELASIFYQADAQILSKLEFIKKCVQNIENNKSVFPMFKVTEKIIHQSSMSYINPKSESLSDLMNYLFKEKNIVDIVMNNLHKFKEDLKQKLNKKDQIQESELDQIVSLQGKLTYQVFQSLPSDMSLNFEIISRIWSEIIVNALTDSERDVLYEWFSRISNQIQLPFSVEDLIRFYDEKMCQIENLQNITTEGFNCYKSVFCVINERKGNLVSIRQQKQYGNINIQNNIINRSLSDNKNMVYPYVSKIEPKNLHGVEFLWDCILYNNQEEAIFKALEFLNKLYTSFDDNLLEREQELRNDYLKQAYQHLQKCIENNSEDSKKIRCLKILYSILDESEVKGIGGLKSLTSMIKGEKISLTIYNEFSSFSSNLPKKFVINAYINQTILDLTKQVAQAVKTWTDQVYLVIDETNSKIRSIDNGKTLSQMRLKNGQGLTVHKKLDAPQVPQADLIIDGQLNPKCAKIFNSWFLKFSTKGKMDHAQCAQFIQSCTNDNCQKDDNRVKQVFANFDEDKDDFLTAEDFQRFYYNSCRDRENVVWSNLHSHHYRNDLLRYDEVPDERVDVKKLPRYILSKDEQFFKLIFILLDQKGQVANETWKLVSRLPPSPIIYKKIVALQEVREAQNKEEAWNKYLSLEHKYTLLYNLLVIEHLLESNLESSQQNSGNQIQQGVKKEQIEQDGDQETQQKNENNNNNQNEIVQFFEIEDEKLKKQYEQWDYDFINLGGFDHLIQIFNKLESKNIAEQDLFNKSVISLVLKIFQNYLLPTFSIKEKSLHKALNYIKLSHIPLRYIIQEIRFDKEKIIKQKISSKNEDSSSNMQEDRDQEDEEVDMLLDQLLSDDDNTVKEGEEISSEEMQKQVQLELAKYQETEQFTKLVQELSQGQGEQIQRKFDFQEFLSLLSNLTYYILNKEDLESEDRSIIEHSLITIALILLHDHKMINYFFEKIEKSEQILLQGLFCQNSENIRSIFSHVFFIIAHQTKMLGEAYPTQKILNILINNIPGADQKKRQNCEDYFQLLCCIIDDYFYYGKNAEQEDKLINFQSLTQQVIKKLRSHPSQEQRTAGQEDKILNGLLNLLEKLLASKKDIRQKVGLQSQDNLVSEIFTKCLFDVNDRENITDDEMQNYDENYVKCKNYGTRQSAYNLLLTLIKDSPQNLQILLEEGFKQLLDKIKKYNFNFNQYYGFECKSPEGFVGIKNLGCICYMNSMLQQFFMTPSFRKAILMADDKQEPNWQRDKKDRFVCDDNVLHQLQNMFGFLESSDRMDFNPEKFCFSFKDWEGNPVNVGVQQDAQEFLNMAFDKIENGLKQTPFRYILDDVYGGKTVTQLICKDCGNVINREETFTNLSIEVKNQKSVYTSMEKFIQGEVINDYNCSACEKKVDIKKRCCLSSLPNVLIMHLQRIIFDLDYLQNVKINSKLEFPLDLNLEPYTKEGLEWREKQEKEMQENGHSEQKAYQEHPQEYYEYKLAGVAVHIGTAEYGHYYSFIDINRNKEMVQQVQLHQQEWLEFNDSRVKDFSLKNLESECFGGIIDNDNDGFSWNRRDNSKNAYMLVYERKIKEPLRLVYQSHEELKKHANEVKLLNYKNYEIQEKKNDEGKLEQIEMKVPYYDMGEVDYKNMSIYKHVWQDNQQFMVERHIFNPQLFKFIKDLCQQVQIPELTPENTSEGYYSEWKSISEGQKKAYISLIDIISKLIFELITKINDKSMISELLNKLKSLLLVVPDYAMSFFNQFVEQNYQMVQELMIQKLDWEVRSAMGRVLNSILQPLVAFNKFKLAYNSQKKSQEENSVIQFLSFMLNLLPGPVAAGFTKYKQYFDFWQSFIFSSEAGMRFAHDNLILARFMDFFIGSDKTPLVIFKQPQNQIGNRFYSARYKPVLQVIITLLIDSKNSTYPEVNPSLNNAKQQSEKFDLNVYDKKCLYNQFFWDKLFAYSNEDSMQANKNISLSELISCLIQHMAYENEFLSEVIAQVILKNIYLQKFDECLSSLYTFLLIEDSLQFKRIQWIIGVPSLQQSGINFGLSVAEYGKEQDISIYSYKSTLNTHIGEVLLKAIIPEFTRSTKTMGDKNSQAQSICLLFKLCMENENIKNYLFSLPSPKYNFCNLSDYLIYLLEQYIDEGNRITYYMMNREEIQQNCQETLQKIKPVIKEYLDSQKPKINEIYEKNKLIPPVDTIEIPQIVENGEKISDEVLQKLNDQNKQKNDGEVQFTTGLKLLKQQQLQQKKRSSNVSQYLPQEFKAQRPLFNTYLMGKTQEIIEIQTLKYDFPEDYVPSQIAQGYGNQRNYMNKFVQNNAPAQKFFILQEFEAVVPILKSEPNGIGNFAIDDSWGKEQEDEVENENEKQNENEKNLNEKNENENKKEENELEMQEIQKEQEQEQAAAEEINRKQQLQTSNCIRYLQLQNYSNECIQVIIDFEIKQQEFVNQQLPPQLSIMLEPKGTNGEKKVPFVFHKIIPELDWSDYEYKVSYRIFRNHKRGAPEIYVSNFTDYDLGLFQ
ncbi:Armadillo-type fold [Pseudocohnilembus persalinus]|uniref:Armadillo-type fold n=1 Tax=Pseudocohnilembus persalinus TaxID=266149 RepID=A0A0V0QCA4_PSEPJ|nr:Armadillo-type fold [Pseudocohnilembus persalinus]|eukprot:KRW99755.1 Armadillo-type fold [Pseudocohnilembus persalinus]